MRVGPSKGTTRVQHIHSSFAKPWGCQIREKLAFEFWMTKGKQSMRGEA